MRCGRISSTFARVSGVGDDARLRAGERDRSVAEVVDRHCGERARDPLTDRKQHVELARVRTGRSMGQSDEVVGRPAHRREDADDVVACVARSHEPASDRLALRTRDGCATELLDDQTHDETLRQSSARETEHSQDRARRRCPTSFSRHTCSSACRGPRSPTPWARIRPSDAHRRIERLGPR